MPSPEEERDSPEIRDGFVALGRILSPHGIAGELKVLPLLDHPDRFQVGRSVYTVGERHLIERCRWQRGQALLKISGINDSSAAEGLRGQYLQAPESDFKPLEEGRYYHFQLIGLG
ncbi:MAG TPA: ribosome maturation factor RimM, partial [Dehalococcoidia bacterium]|nr:ribosome maturation factor RimM [Dehalococcoidia bacterium]